MTTTDTAGIAPRGACKRAATGPGLAHSALVAIITLAVWAAFVVQTMKDQGGGILLGM